MPKRTYQPSKRKRARRFGFLAAKKRKKRLAVISNRRRKKRQRVTPPL